MIPQSVKEHNTAVTSSSQVGGTEFLFWSCKVHINLQETVIDCLLLVIFGNIFDYAVYGL